MKKKLSILMLLAALIVPWASKAQNLSEYTVTTGTTTYASIANADSLLSSVTGDGGTQTVVLPFNFPFGEDVYLAGTSITVRADGYLYFGSTNPGHSSKSAWTSTTDYSLIAPLITYDGKITASGATSGAYKALMTDDNGDPMLVIEFKGLQCYYSDYGSYNFQVRLHPNGNISTVYGSQTATTNTSMVHNFFLINGVADKVCLTGSFASPVAGTPAALPNLSTMPTSGKVITYNRPIITCPKPLGISALLSTDEMTISWVPGGTETEWEVMLDSVAYPATDTFYTFSSLDPNTLYNVAVRAVCGVDDSSLWRSGQFRTLCVPVDSDSLPWIYGFEDASANAATATFNPCLGRHVEGSTTAWPYPSATHHGSGAHSLYMYSTSAIHSWLTLPLFDEDLDQLQLSFYAYRGTTATYGHWAVGVMTDPSDITTFDTIASGQVSQNSLWELVEVPLNNYTGNGTYLAILCPKGSAANYTYVDDITVGYLPSCITPTNIVGSNATSNTVDVSWTSTADEFIIEYGLQGFTQGTGDSVTSATNSVTLNNLRMGMTYSVYVTAVCGSDTSNSAYGTVTTGCATITSSDLPYMEDFETYGSGSAYPINTCWTKGTSSSTAYPYPTSTVVSGARSLYFYGYYPSSTSTTPVYSWAALPPVDDDLDISTLQINFKVKRGSTASTYYTTLLYVGIAESVTGLTSAAAIDTQVTWIDTLNYYSTASSSANSIHDAEVTFDTYTGTGKYIVIYAPVPPLQGSSTYAYNYAYVDDIALRTIPTCYWPTSVALESVSTDEVTISWTPDPRTANPNGWSVEYGLHGFTPGGGTVSSESTTSATLTNLLPNTEYDVYVSADCGSEMSDPAFFSFRTECTALDTLPYVQDFENEATTTSTSYDFAPCMHRLNNGTQYFGYPYIANSTTYNHTTGGTKGLYWYGCTTTGTYGDYQIVVLPAVDTNIYPINTLQLRFWAKSSSTSYHPVFQVGVMTNPYDASTFQRMETVDVGTNTTWTEFTVALGSYTGQGQYVAIKAVRPSSSWYAYVDDITLELMPPCPAIVGIEAATTVGSAVLTWDWQSGYDAPAGYVVTYDSIGGTSPTTVNVTTNNAVITGLAANTTYKAYVMADCGSDGFGRMDSVTFTTGDFGCAELDPASIDSVIFSNSTTGQSGCLAYSSYGNTAYQAIWTATELTAAGLSAGPITGIDLGFTASTYSKEFTIFIGNTTTTSIASTTFEVPTEEMRVYGPAAHPSGTSGWQHYDFTTPFNWDGTSSIIITTFMNQPSGTSQTVSTDLKGYYTSASNRARYRYKDSNPFTLDNVSSTGTAASTYSYRASIHFHIAECQTQAVCAAPSLMLGDVAATTVDLAWAPGYDETAWDVDYRVLGDTAWTNAASGVNTTNYTVTGLQDATEYEFRVSFYCSSDDTTYASFVSAITKCLPLTVPYNEDFESYGSGSAASISSCWVKGTSSTTAYPYPYSTNAITGSRSLYFYGYYPSTTSTTPVYSYAALPAFQEPITDLMMEFKVRTYPTTGSYYTTILQVGVMTDPEDISTFTAVDTINLVGEVAGSVHNVSVSFSNYTGNGQYIAIYDPVPPLVGTNTYGYSYAYVDDILVDHLPVCPRVENITVNALLTSATISWEDTSSTNTSWYVEYDTVDFIPGTGHMTALHVTDTFVVLNGLDSGTVYHVYVYPDCGISILYRHATFRTLAASPATVPYVCDFEAAGVNGWELFTTGQTNYWMVGNATGNTGRSLYVTNNGSSNDYTNNSISYSYAVRYFNITDSGDYAYSFDWKCNGEGNYDFVRVLFVPTSMNIEAGTPLFGTSAYNFGQTVAPSPWIDLTGKTTTPYGLNLQTTWQNRTGVMHISTLGTYQLVFAWVNDGSGGTTPPAAIDNVVLSFNTCPVVDSVAATVSYNTIDLTWTAGGSETEWEVTVDTVAYVVNTPAYTATGLSSNTDYVISIRPICSTTDTGFAHTETFHTACAPISVPYTEDFESYNSGTSASISPCWVKGTNSATAYPYPSTTAISGSRSLYFYAYHPSTTTSTPIYSYAALPMFQQPLDSLQLDFKVRTYSSAYNYYTTYLVVGVMTNPNDINTFVGVDTINLFGAAASSVHDISVTFASYTGNGQYIAIYDPVPPLFGTSTYDYSYAYVDDIMVDYLPTCPKVEDLVSTSTSTTSITIDWTDVATGTPEWQVSYSNGTATQTTIVTSHPATISGLSALTGYTFKVRPICSVGDTGHWSMEAMFSTTMCDNAVIASTGASDGTGYTTPVNNLWKYTLSETIIDSAELAGIGDITSIAYSYAYSTAMTDKTDVTIWLQPTNKTAFTSSSDLVVLDTTIAVQVYHGDLNCSLGWNYFSFTAPYTWDGHSNLLVIVDDNSNDYNSSTYVFDKTSCTEYKTIEWHSDSYNPDPTSTSYSGTKNYYQYRATMQLISCGAGCANPSSLHTTSVTYNSVSVAWSGTDSAEVGIREGLWDETGATITTVTTSNYTFTGLTPNTQYTVAARTLCEDNMTSDWVYLSVTTEDLPCFAPSNIQVSNQTTNGGKVTWTPGGNENEWVVNVFRTGIIDTNITVINTPMCNVSGLYAATTYTISVASVCGGIDTVWCDSTATLTTTACLPPTNVEAVANGHNAMVTWTSSGANEYHVLWYLEGFTTGADSVVVTNGTTNATITGLAQSETYDIYVFAYCDGQRSAQAGQTQVTITGIDDVNSSLINLYPNPANTTVTVDGIQGEAIVTIVDMNGRTVFSEKAVGKLTIDLNGMAQGAYFVRITGENTTAIRKLIVK